MAVIAIEIMAIELMIWLPNLPWARCRSWGHMFASYDSGQLRLGRRGIVHFRRSRTWVSLLPS